MGKMMMTILLTCGLGQGWAQTLPGPASKTKAPQNKPRATQKSPVKPSTQLVEQRAVLTTLTDDLLAVAAQVHTGSMVCEESTVKIAPIPTAQGYFDVHMGKHHYLMAPVASQTGAIRLEDTAHGAVWIQLANKSMLMNSKLGQRMADECQSPAQVAVAEAMKKGPAFNLLEGPAAPSVTRK